MATPFQFDRSKIVPMMRRMSLDLFVQHGRQLYQRATEHIEPLSTVISGAAAAEYLDRQDVRLKNALATQAQAFPSHWWILLLRYISPVIFDCSRGSYTRYRGTAERASAESTRKLENVPSFGILDEPQIKRAIRLVTTSVVRERVRHAAGMVNAGAVLEPDKEEGFRLSLSDELKKLSGQFDTRLRLVDQDVFTRMGAAYLTPPDPNNITYDRTLMGVSALELPITPESFDEDELADLIQFAPVLFTLDPALSQLPWSDISRELGVQIRVLSSVMRLAFVDVGIRPTLWERLHESGLINRPQRELDNYLTQLCTEANTWGEATFPGTSTVTSEDVISIVTINIGGRSGRYYGPALRLGHDFFCIDLLAAWLRLEAVIASATSGGGKAPNMRAEMWERTVQHAINQTAWKPNESLAAAISRPLKRDGKVFSDLDAAGARDGALLVVSCKSWQMAERYDNLDYSARKNRALDVIKAAGKLAADIKMLGGLADRFVAPQGLTSIRGVVCVSMPMLLTLEETIELHRTAPGVDILTLPELISYLDGPAPRKYDPESWRRYMVISHQHGPNRVP